MTKYRVAVAGAGGVVGQCMIEQLHKRNFPASEIHAWASEASVGKNIEVAGNNYTLDNLSTIDPASADLILSALPNSVAEWFVPKAIKAGCTIIDNSSRFRLEPDVPLIVPEINADQLAKKPKLIANPNCFTAGLVVALNPLKLTFGIDAVSLTAMGSVSGAGKSAIVELINGIGALDNPPQPEVFPHSIIDNVLPQVPQIDAFLNDGYTTEEDKIIKETQKILAITDLPVAVTAVRVPIRYGHSLSVSAKLTRQASFDDIANAMLNQPGLVVCKDHENYPHPLQARFSDPVYVGRIRIDRFAPQIIHFWVVSDNLLKGAALNAVQIAEVLFCAN